MLLSGLVFFCVGVPLVGFCCTLWILGKLGACGLPSRECFCSQWVAERIRGKLGERTERGYRKEVRGSYSYSEVGSRGLEVWW